VRSSCQPHGVCPEQPWLTECPTSLSTPLCADNANELRRKLNLLYNRKRQAKITTELTEIVSGANA
jgi:hypothetical protein